MDCSGNDLGSLVVEVVLDPFRGFGGGIGGGHHLALVRLVGGAHGECGEAGSQGALRQGSSRGLGNHDHARIA